MSRKYNKLIKAIAMAREAGLPQGWILNRITDISGKTCYNELTYRETDEVVNCIQKKIKEKKEVI